MKATLSRRALLAAAPLALALPAAAAVPLPAPALAQTPELERLRTMVPEIIRHVRRLWLQLGITRQSSERERAAALAGYVKGRVRFRKADLAQAYFVQVGGERLVMLPSGKSLEKQRYQAAAMLGRWLYRPESLRGKLGDTDQTPEEVKQRQDGAFFGVVFGLAFYHDDPAELEALALEVIPAITEAELAEFKKRKGLPC